MAVDEMVLDEVSRIHNRTKTITWRCSDDDDGVYWLQGISISQQFLYKRVWNRVEDMEGIPETCNKIKHIVYIGYKVSQ